MILVTGGTGFIGKALVRNLVEAGHSVRMLLKPSPRSPDLPNGISVEVAVSSLNDERGLRAAMVGIDAVYHLASVERRGAYASLMNVDVMGTRAILKAVTDADVNRFFYVSHLGAGRASAYPVLKAKAIAEEFIRKSGIDYTILRTALVYGPNDSFTTGLARLISSLPLIFLVPGNGKNLLQPLWVEDLATCLVWALDDESSRNKMVEIGGPEHLTFSYIVETVMQVIDVHRRMVFLRPPYLRGITVALEAFFPGFPVSVYWLDYLATNRTCALDTLPRAFNLMPARITQRLDYLRDEKWRRSLLRDLFRKRI